MVVDVEEKIKNKKEEVQELLNSEKIKIKGYLKKIDEENSKINEKPEKTTIWQVLAYFIIYSFLGFVIETIFALLNYGVFESRQSFLYGPFCSIYGVGAVVIILSLRYKFFKNNYTLFAGGFLVGSIVEYAVSFFGEMILNVKWWDYSDRFLNINGRICFLYSIFWGLLGVYLMKGINPRIDKFINWTKEKLNLKVLRVLVAFLIVFLFVDCVISGYAINAYLVRVCVENNLPIENKQEAENYYHYLYDDKEKADLIYKYWNNEKMILTYPNLTITLEDGTLQRVADYYPDVKDCYYRFKNARSIM